LVLPGGREVGVALCGRGVPLVVVHGFGGEAILYAQTLSRLVRSGFRVIALDGPGHGRSDAVPVWSSFADHRRLLGETLDHLGIERAVFVGHSMGGRVVSELAADQPERVIALVLVDAIVGPVWDRMVQLFRFAPALYAAFGLGLLADTAATVPLWSDPRQAAKLARLLSPTGVGHLRRPWRLAGPALTILAAPNSDPVLTAVAGHGLAGFVIHGDRDLLVPLANARQAAERLGAHLITVHGARHSWLLADPEAFPAVLSDLLGGPLGAAVQRAAATTGDGTVPPGGLTALDNRFCRPGAAVFALTPGVRPVPLRHRHRAPRHRWSVSAPGA
jgi:pimeloyl-ACP methyl ester carboxylesterase